MIEFTNQEFDRYRRIARLCAVHLPEGFAVDALLMLYEICVAHDLSPAEMVEMFGQSTLHFIEAGAHTAYLENPQPGCKIDTGWERPFVITEIGCIGKDRVLRRATDADEGGKAFLFQEIFRRRRSGGPV